MLELTLGGLLGAVALDWILGDPSWLPHPVRWFGRVVNRIDTLRRAVPGSPALWGTVLALGLPTLVYAGTWGLLAGAQSLHPLIGGILSAILLWTTVSFRDLWGEADRVRSQLEARDLPRARRQLGRIVGRDTDRLSESEIARATVETVAEGYLDGVLSPLFWAMMGGVPGALAYKAINTMDSMVGYRTEEYRRFGAPAARLDDIANWIPARLSVGLIGTAAVFGLPAATALRVGWRDRTKHPSPNAAHPEATFAGALGCRLGGASEYGGVCFEKPALHAEAPPPDHRHVCGSLRLLRTTHLLTVGMAGLLLIVMGHGEVLPT